MERHGFAPGARAALSLPPRLRSAAPCSVSEARRIRRLTFWLVMYRAALILLLPRQDIALLGWMPGDGTLIYTCAAALSWSRTSASPSLAQSGRLRARRLSR